METIACITECRRHGGEPCGGVAGISGRGLWHHSQLCKASTHRSFNSARSLTSKRSINVFRGAWYEPISEVIDSLRARGAPRQPHADGGRIANTATRSHSVSWVFFFFFFLVFISPSPPINPTKTNSGHKTSLWSLSFENIGDKCHVMTLSAMCRPSNL